MKKYTVVVPTKVFVSITVEAEDENDAEQKTEDMDFSVTEFVNMGGGLCLSDANMELEGGDPDWDGLLVYEVKP